MTHDLGNDGLAHVKQTEQPGCKGSSASVRISPEEIVSLFGQTFKVKEIKLVTEAEYDERIATCMDCPALQNGTTCQHCGCLVHLKAKLKASKCPFPYSSKWSQD
jgi:predicted Zn-ribbon and HTH transcriptional regulator